MGETISITKKKLLLVVILIAAITGFFFFSPFKTGNSIKEVSALEARFNQLSNANSNSCGGTFNYVDSMPDEARIQGSCCSAMNFHSYIEQVEGLKKYAKYEKIPPDPYDAPVSLAKELLDYQKSIVLTESQQEIYNQAMKLSHEGGPCCCKCWHWYAYEGLAKYLIVNEGFTAEQIADVWDLSDACGGSGHTH